MPDIVGTLKPPRLSAAPSSPANGQMYYDTGLNQLLYWNGTTWIAGSGGGGGGLTPVAVSAPYTASVSQLVLMTGAYTVTLPAAPAAGAVVAVEALTATATVQRGGTDTINYASTAGMTSVVIPIGTQITFTYLSGVWYGAAVAGASAVYQVASQARAYRNAAMTFTGATWTKIPLDTVTYDAGQNLQIANSRYVCPVGGYYQVDGMASWLTGTFPTDLIAAIYVNGTSRAFSNRVNVTASAPGGGAWNVLVSDVVQCNPGDVIELWGYASQSYSLSPGSTTVYLSVSLVGTQPTAAPANAARASRVAAFAPAASTWTKVPLDTITHDAGGNFSVANGRYVCPMAGVYDVFGALEFSESATATYTQMGIAFYKNGVLYSSNVSFFAVQTVMSMSIADKIQCNAGDYLELWAYNSQATGLVATVNANWLSVSLLK